jgi:hypothetical protein
MAMDALLARLAVKSRNDEEKAVVDRLINLLSVIRRFEDPARAPPGVVSAAWEDYTFLSQNGFWDDGDQDSELVRQTIHGLASATTSADRADGKAPEFSIEVAPSQTSSFELGRTHLPIELVETIERIYFLHVLATEPTSILPPGKTLVSALASVQESSSTEQIDESSTLHSHVEQAVHRVFWDEVSPILRFGFIITHVDITQALSSLSSTTPATQLARIKGLQDDLFTELKPLFPSKHPALAPFAFPMSPTSDPLRSYALHLRSAAVSLRERCAPARDELIDSVLTKLDDPLPSGTALASTVVDATRALFKIANLMRSDFAHAVLGRMQERELIDLVRAQAMSRERSFVLEHWTRSQLVTSWTEWRAKKHPQDHQDLLPKWHVRLVQCLESSIAVTYPLPGVSPPSNVPSNTLPPYLFFTTQALLHLQNLMQALTITACLRTLAGLSAGSEAGSAFSARVLALLRGEVDAPDSGETKLVHLADEVVQARGAVGAEEEGEKLRAAVARTLRTEDPVFGLLHKRLADALVSALDNPNVTTPSVAPDSIRTGCHLQFPRSQPIDRSSPRVSVVTAKGFEEECLREGMDDVFAELQGIIHWTDDLWGDALY